MIISKPGVATLRRGNAAACEATDAAEGLDPRLSIVLGRLQRAHRLAEDCGRPRVEFAISFDELQGAGISTADLRWLQCQQLVTHWQASPAEPTAAQLDEAPTSTLYSTRSWFTLTEAGIERAADLQIEDEPCEDSPAERAGRDGEVYGERSAAFPHAEWDGSVTHKPSWDSERHELRCGSMLVKKFKWRASNQERILAAFQEEGWPARIDDPLPPRPEIDSKRRLGDTIKCLNRNQLAAIIKFVGDGSGQGVIWEFQADRPRKTK